MPYGRIYEPAARFWRGVVDLVPGPNAINHNLNIPNPEVDVDTRLALTGEEVSLRVSAEASNFIVINSPVALTGVRITIIGVNS